MKIDSESTYHHPYPNDHTPKVIVHNGNHFILPQDNHFMVDILDIDETSKEGIYDVESPNEYDCCKGIHPPKQHGIPNMEWFINKNNNEYDILKSSYSGSNPEIGLVVKEDFYANKAVDEVEASEKMVVCVNDGSCHRVENISEVMHSFQNNFVEKQEASQETSFSSNKSSNIDDCNAEKEMKDTASSPDFKYGVVDGDPITITRYPAEATSIVRNSAESCSCVSTIEGGDKLDTAALIKSVVSEGGDKLNTAELVKCNVLEGGYKLDTNDSVASDSLDKVIEIELPSSEELEKKMLQVDSSSLGLQVDSSSLGLQVDSSSLCCSDDQRQSIDILDDITEKHLLPSEELNKDSLQVDSSSLGLQVYSSSLGCSDDQGQSIGILDEVTEKHLFPSEELNKNSLQVDSSSLGCSDDQKQSMDILDKVTEEQLSPSEELNRDSLQVDSSSLGCSHESNDQKQSIDRPQNDQAIFEENSTTTNVSSGAKDFVLSDERKEVLSSCKVPTEVITFTFDPQVTSISGEDKNKENRDSQETKMTHIGPGIEAASSDGATTSTRRSLRSLVHGDSNLNGPGFLPGPIANSGHISYSGNISLRSDSSTTSARSFAFPILHSEWNSSPVKMAKATRRRGWRTGLLCCRF